MTTRANAEPRTHDGFQFRGTAGFGYLGDSESAGPLSDNIHGVAGTSEFFFGGTLAPGFSLGGYLGGTVAPGPSLTSGGRTLSGSGLDLNFFTLGPYVDYYFDPTQGFHLLATVGFADLNVSNGSDNGNAATGFGIGIGAGYDWWVSEEWSLGLLARFQYAHMTFSEGGASATENTIAPTIAFSFCFQ